MERPWIPDGEIRAKLWNLVPNGRAHSYISEHAVENNVYSNKFWKDLMSAFLKYFSL
jgi:hypothetical protein